MTDTHTALDSSQKELLAFTFIKKEWLGHELTLFSTKWFDYRQLSPVEATERYIEAYRKAFRDHYARSLDAERADYIRVLGGADPISGFTVPKLRPMIVGCWRGRQMADALGMPYEVYTDLAMGFRLRFWQRAYLPQPQHLYDERDLERIQSRWEELQGARLFVSTLPVYHLEAYQGVGFQNDHHEWLLKQAGLRANPQVHLARFVTQGLLPREKAIARTPVARQADLDHEIMQASEMSL